MAEVKSVQFNGNGMKYIEFGRGKKTFVILPGLSIHSVMGLKDAVERLYSIFAEDYTVYLFDRAEHLRKGYTIEDMADDTASAMKALGLDFAYVFGASQGGMIAIYLASRYPALVKKLILASTLSESNPTFEEVGKSWIESAGKRDEEGLIESFVDSIYGPATLEKYRASIISSSRGISDEEWKRFSILASACLSYDSSAELGKIECPVLVLASDGDRVVTAAASRKIASSVRNAELYIYPDTYGHAVYDEAEDYRKRCLEFFDR